MWGVERARQRRRPRTSRFQSPSWHLLFCLPAFSMLGQRLCLCSEDQCPHFYQLQCSLTFSRTSNQQLSPLPPTSYWIITIDIIISCYFSQWNTKQQQKPLLSPLSISLLSFTAKPECRVHNLFPCHCLTDALKSECCFPHFTEATLAKAHSGNWSILGSHLTWPATNIWHRCHKLLHEAPSLLGSEDTMKVKEETGKAGLKLIQKTKLTASGPINSWQRDG